MWKGGEGLASAPQQAVNSQQQLNYTLVDEA